MIEDQILENAKERMEECINSLKTTFQGIRTSRASPNLLDRIKAEVYGVLTPIQQLASITTPEPRMISIQCWDKAAVKPLEKAIRESSLGLSPTIDGQVLRIIFPELTKERREELTKYAGKCAEESKISIRSIRREAVDQYKKMEKNSELTEDDLIASLETIQKTTDKYNEKIESLLEVKQKDIMTL